MGGGIGDTVPEEAAEFLDDREMVVVAARVPGGASWVTLLAGYPGFARAVGEHAVQVDIAPGPGDPLAFLASAADHPVGLLAIDPATRRRLRVNGLATGRGDTTGRGGAGGFTVVTTQVFGNCPKYIRPREVVALRAVAAVGGTDRLPERGMSLTPAQQKWVATADTFFVGTADVDGAADASHRGGAPGFVEVVGPEHLRFPEYRGNSMYTTLGNLERNPAVGLLFVDWEAGDTLQVTGIATVDHDLDRAHEHDPRARRLVDVAVTGVVELPGRSPLRWRPIDAA